MLTDISTDKQNKAIPSRTDKEGKPVSQSNLRGLFGNNSIWFIPTSGENVGNAYLFGLCPIDGEVCGPNFTSDRQALFLSIQHPGEFSGVRRDMASEERIFAIKTTDDREFSQIRQVPIGSNWPGKQPNDPPKPSVIIVRRSDGNRFR
jgi:secreted PhoX family phosphatase